MRVDWDTPKRLGKVDIEAFLHHLSGIPLTGVTRARKLAAIRKFFSFLQENGILQTNLAATVKGARREEKEPLILATVRTGRINLAAEFYDEAAHLR
ncbi:MAG: site-specific integrase [Alphaproteobacteria bacterium]|nr:site-specific integrase [Alphaproteobacteria bacterium]